MPDVQKLREELAFREQWNLDIHQKLTKAVAAGQENVWNMYGPYSDDVYRVYQLEREMRSIRCALYRKACQDRLATLKQELEQTLLVSDQQMIRHETGQPPVKEQSPFPSWFWYLAALVAGLIVGYFAS